MITSPADGKEGFQFGFYMVLSMCVFSRFLWVFVCSSFPGSEDFFQFHCMFIIGNP